jgi:hypothetical protein
MAVRRLSEAVESGDGLGGPSYSVFSTPVS